MTDLFWKVVAGALIAMILTAAVGKQEKDLALLISIASCAMIMVTAFSFLEPVLDFLHKLENMGNLEYGMLKTLLKMTGIGVVSEVAGIMLTDSGNASLAKGIQLLGTTVILWLSLPILETLLELVQNILGEL